MSAIAILLLVSAQVNPMPIEERRQLVGDFYDTYVKGEGGFASERKYLDRTAVEIGLILAAQGDERAKGMVQKTLLKNTFLLDREDGGAFAYSLPQPNKNPWRSPAGDKPADVQAHNLYLYSLAHEQFGGHRFLDAAEIVFRRMAQTKPTDPRSVHALATYHRVTRKRDALELAVFGAERIIDRSAEDVSLEEAVLTSQAFLSLFLATQDVRWLLKTEASVVDLRLRIDESWNIDHDVLVELARLGSQLASLTASDAARFIAREAYRRVYRKPDRDSTQALLLVELEYRHSAPGTNHLAKVLSFHPN